MDTTATCRRQLSNTESATGSGRSCRSLSRNSEPQQTKAFPLSAVLEINEHRSSASGLQRSPGFSSSALSGGGAAVSKGIAGRRGAEADWTLGTADVCSRSAFASEKLGDSLQLRNRF
ncbi:hypothetical protein MHYP_G00033820 [Metynnis hypsauchen]